MRFLIIAASLLASTSAFAGVATGDCTTQRGTKIIYGISAAKGFLYYDDDGPHQIFSERKGNLGIITHIGNRGNMRMAIDLDTGRGYIVTRLDDGRVIEGNVICKLGYKE